MPEDIERAALPEVFSIRSSEPVQSRDATCLECAKSYTLVMTGDGSIDGALIVCACGRTMMLDDADWS